MYIRNKDTGSHPINVSCPYRERVAWKAKDNFLTLQKQADAPFAHVGGPMRHRPHEKIL